MNRTYIRDKSFEWLIGINTLDNDSLQAIADLKQADKRKSRNKL